jgi:thiol-disulfide isomerase/thioredoxin
MALVLLGALSCALLVACSGGRPPASAAPAAAGTVAPSGTPAAGGTVAAAPCPTSSTVRLAGFGTTRLPCLVDPDRRVVIGAGAGRPEIINFWASWCAPCRQEAALLEAAYRANGDRIVFVGVDSQDERAAALRFLAASGTTYPQVFDAPAAFAASIGAAGLPYTLFVNASGEIVDRSIGALTPQKLQSGLAHAGAATTGSG